MRWKRRSCADSGEQGQWRKQQQKLTLATTIAKIAIRAKGLRHFSLESCSSLYCQGLENLSSCAQHKSIALVTEALSILAPKPAGELWHSWVPPATVPGCPSIVVKSDICCQGQHFKNFFSHTHSFYPGEQNQTDKWTSQLIHDRRSIPKSNNHYRL